MGRCTPQAGEQQSALPLNRNRDFRTRSLPYVRVPVGIFVALLYPVLQRGEELARFLLGQVDPDFVERLARRSLDARHQRMISDGPHFRFEAEAIAIPRHRPLSLLARSGTHAETPGSARSRPKRGLEAPSSHAIVSCVGAQERADQGA